MENEIIITGMTIYAAIIGFCAGIYVTAMSLLIYLRYWRRKHNIEI